MATAATPQAADATAVRALAEMVRAMFPHPAFPDGPYERCAQAILAAAAEDLRFRRSSTRACATSTRSAASRSPSCPPSGARAPARHQRDGVLRGRARARDHHALRRPRGVGAARLRGPVLRPGRLPEPRLRRPRLAARPEDRARWRHDDRERATAAAASRSPRRSTRAFGHDDEDLVVVIGSGAGGGTLANELCQQGVRVVVLEAGPHLTGDDYVNDEWPAFNQMAWLDPRTTSGSLARRARLPEPPGLDGQGGRRHDDALGRRLPALQGLRVPRAVDLRRRSTARTCSTGRSALADLEPYYDQAEVKMGVTHVHGRPPLPANNNYKVFANGAERVGYTRYATGPYATNAEPYDGRPASIQDGFNFQGDKHGSKWSTLVAELPKAGKTGNLDLRPDCQAVQITHDARGRADGVLYLDGDGDLQRQRARVVVRRGQRDRDGAAAAPLRLAAAPRRAGELLGPGRAQLHAPRDRLGLRALRQAGAHVPRRDDGRRRRRRGRPRPGPRLRGRLLLRDARRSGRRSSPRSPSPGAWGPEFTEIMDAYANTAGLWITGEDMPQETNRVTLNAASPTSTGCRCRTCTSTTTPTTSRCASTRGRRARRCTRRSARPARTARRRTRRRTTWARRA